MHCIQHYANDIRKVNEINYVNIGKEEMKQSLFVNDMIVFVDNAKESIVKLLEWISKFSKIIGFKANRKTQLYFYELVITDRKQKF